ncbi:glycoside hydrolase family 51 protein [Acephala macrosclerotiorum]|nr:glycoside hydrolase family 51 protein [Acephala macrosclerotiorum]
MFSLENFCRSLGLASLIFSGLLNATTLTVSTTGGNASSPLLYGLMFEDINNSGDGGIHGQLLKNNGFQGTSPTISPYGSVGGTTITRDTSTPLTSAITSSLEVSVPSGTTGYVGFSNAGYNGVPVNLDTYANYFWVKGAYSGIVTLELVGASSGTVYASQNLTITSVAGNFTYIATTFASTQSPDGNNVWQLTFDGSKVAGGSLWFALPQLFPVTYHARYNGIRLDVGNFLEAMNPSFLRFPGGNNLEGASPADRWKWNETIGPVEDRPGRQGDWGYANTDALGLMEYLQWCEDMKLAPVLAIWSGLSLGGGIVSGTALTPYVNDALNELEFLLGSTSTTLGALRSSYGHPAPYNVTMLEIGNEDNLSSGCSTYASRFTEFYDAIHAAYPSITIIASTTSSSCLPSPLPSGVWTDIHHYEEPHAFISLFNEFDNYPRTNGSGIFVGEYANTADDSGATTYWSTVQGAVSEAVYMIGLERNSDLVKMASYAPLLEHYDVAEWSPDLVGLDARPGSLTGSVSYYVQKLFSTARGNTILPVTSDTAFNPLFWVASSTTTGIYYIKLANYGTTTQNVTVKIPNASGVSATAGLQTLTGGATSSNYPLDVTVTPTSATVSGSASGGWTFSVPGYGVAILTVSPA